ncbi:putative [Escherichia phage Mu]|uniref:Bacteriophage Mu left end n=1 Tax=Escherichia phage Mu TaxID=2681603 RepID=Q38474_BPMU|nr:putative [Escherichia phage Mu]
MITSPCVPSRRRRRARESGPLRRGASFIPSSNASSVRHSRTLAQDGVMVIIQTLLLVRRYSRAASVLPTPGLPHTTAILSVRLAKRILVQICFTVCVSTKRGGSGSSATA